MASNLSTDILSDPRIKPMQQEYEKYTSEDFQVWKILFDRQKKIFPELLPVNFWKGWK